MDKSRLGIAPFDPTSAIVLNDAISVISDVIVAGEIRKRDIVLLAADYAGVVDDLKNSRDTDSLIGMGYPLDRSQNADEIP